MVKGILKYNVFHVVQYLEGDQTSIDLLKELGQKYNYNIIFSPEGFDPPTNLSFVSLDPEEGTFNIQVEDKCWIIFDQLKSPYKLSEEDFHYHFQLTDD